MKSAKEFIMSINVSGVHIGTWVRAVMLFIYLLGFAAEMFDITIPVIDENSVASAIAVIVGAIVFLQSFWKNNSFTESAQKADEIMKEKKKESKL